MPARLKNGVTGARGGKREGAGRKKSAATVLKQLEIENAHHHAAESLAMLVELRDNAADKDFKRAVCNDIMDRVWGKPKTLNEFSGKGGGPIQTSNGSLDAVLEKMTPDQVVQIALAHVERAA